MSGLRSGQWLATAASVVVVATLAAAIAVMGPPSVQRQLKLDQKRVADLQRIARLVENHANRSRSLPPDLATLVRQPGMTVATGDPLDGAPYGYQVTGERSYRLCATFATDTALAKDDQWPRIDDEWRHGSGRQCFDREWKPKS